MGDQEQQPTTGTGIEPVGIPDGMGIGGGKVVTVKGHPEQNILDVQACTGTVGEGENEARFWAMLCEIDAMAMRHLHLDPRFWLIQWGPRLRPFRLEPAFTSPLSPIGDPVAEELRALGKLLAAGWFAHANGDPVGLEEALKVMIEKVHAARVSSDAVERVRRSGGNGSRR